MASVLTYFMMVMFLSGNRSYRSAMLPYISYSYERNKNRSGDMLKIKRHMSSRQSLQPIFQISVMPFHFSGPRSRGYRESPRRPLAVERCAAFNLLQSPAFPGNTKASVRFLKICHVPAAIKSDQSNHGTLNGIPSVCGYGERSTLSALQKVAL